MSDPFSLPTYDDTAPPPGYVPGIGRGAMGFTTRGDIGPGGADATTAVAAAMAAQQQRGAPGLVGGRGRGVVGMGMAAGRGRGRGAVPLRRETDYSESNYDAFAGYGEQLFSDTPYDAEDAKADAIYQEVDRRLAEATSDRRRKRKAKRMRGGKRRTAARAEGNANGDKEGQESDDDNNSDDEDEDEDEDEDDGENEGDTGRRAKQPRTEQQRRIKAQFADLKQGLAQVEESAWDAIPEVGDHSLKYKQSRFHEKYTPLPDYLITEQRGAGSSGAAGTASSAAAAGAVHTSLPPDLLPPAATAAAASASSSSSSSIASGTGASTGTGTGMQSIAMGMAEARGQVLSLKIDRMSDNVSGQTVVDPRGYLTEMNSLRSRNDATVADVQKTRKLFKSLITTNPKHAPGWIAAARHERDSGKLSQAKKLIRQGCKACPDNEDIWIESAALHPPDEAVAILEKAVRHLPRSVPIWLRAAELERDIHRRKQVLRNALENVPNSVKLWKEAIALEEADDARIMLAKAVQCVPHSVDMWLALSRVETYENARKVLNQARQAIPTDASIWITAAKLEEAQLHYSLVDRIIPKALHSLRQHHVVIDRDYWLAQAAAAENEGHPVTCAAIVRNTVGIGVELEDAKATWLDDAETMEAKGQYETARAIYAHSLAEFPRQRNTWFLACMLEKQHPTVAPDEATEDAKAAETGPEADTEAEAETEREAGTEPASRSRNTLHQMLREAVTHCPRAENLWLLAAKEMWLAKDVDEARNILKQAFGTNPNSERIWLAAVKLEWQNDEIERARILLSRARSSASTARVWLHSALLERETGAYEAVFPLIDAAVERYPTFAKFYLVAAQTAHANLRDVERARRYYQQGVERCPESVPLWCELARLEEETRGANKARSILEMAKIKNATSDALWLEISRVERRAGNLVQADNLLERALQKVPESGILWAERIQYASKSKIKSVTTSAVARCEADAHVLLAIARHMQKNRKFPNARRWYESAASANPDLGDVWACYLALERHTGTEEQQQAVIQRATKAEPRYGELWTRVSKKPGNRYLSVEDMLNQAVALIEEAEQAERAIAASVARATASTHTNASSGGNGTDTRNNGR